MTTGVYIAEFLAAGAAEGMLARVDAGLLASKVRVYSDPRPAWGADPAGATLIGELVLNRPVGTVVGPALVLSVPTTPAFASAAAVPTWARWVTGDEAQQLADFPVRLFATPDDPLDPAVMVIEAPALEVGTLLRVTFGQLFILGPG